MKSLEITNNQKLMILEMTKKLFPEFKYIKITNGSCDYCLEACIRLSEKEKPSHNDWLLIHWFEFCLLHLAPKILSRYINVLEYFDNILYEKEHSVEYLYKQFNKLK